MPATGMLALLSCSSKQFAKVSEGPGAPERPNYEHRLKEQPDGSGLIGVQAEGIALFCELGNVARKNRDEEQCRQHAKLLAVVLYENEAQAKNYLDNPRCNYYEVGFERQPGWHLGQELGAVSAEVACAGCHQGNPEQDAGYVSKKLHSHKVAACDGCADEVAK